MNNMGVRKVIPAICVSIILWTSSICSAQAAPQPLEYTNIDFQAIRVEPKGDGIVFNIGFTLNKKPMGGAGGVPCAALEGHGIGREQWPADPVRPDYTFVGWYDNEERTGEPYTMNTPIYQDTSLYAQWKYSGPGGYWPRARRGILHGMEEGGSYNVGQSISITADGYNMHLTRPNDQRFRWMPVGWRVADVSDGSFSTDAPFTATISVGAVGKYTLYISYREEIFDGVNWQETGQTHEAPELSFQVV